MDLFISLVENPCSTCDNCLPSSPHTSRGGGIGRRTGLKIPRWQQREGSIPSLGTITFGFFQCLEVLKSTNWCLKLLRTSNIIIPNSGKTQKRFPASGLVRLSSSEREELLEKVKESKVSAYKRLHAQILLVTVHGGENWQWQLGEIFVFFNESSLGIDIEIFLSSKQKPQPNPFIIGFCEFIMPAAKVFCA